MAKKIVTKKEHIILLLLYISRFLNSKQIQELLNHKDHRRINSWLKDLAEKEYIVREFKPVFGQLTKPAVFYLTAKGRKHIRDSYEYVFPKYNQRIANDKKTSKGFKIRCQLAADFYLTFFKSVDIATKPDNQQEQSNKNDQKKDQVHSGIGIVDRLIRVLQNGDDDKLPMNKFQYFTASYFPSNELATRLKPDGFIRKKTKKGMSYGLLFVVDAYTSRLLLGYLIKRIFTALDEVDWDDEDIETLHIYLLCPNNQLIVYLKRMLPTQIEQNYASYKALNIHMTTRNMMYSKKSGKIEDINWITLSSEEQDEDEEDEEDEE